MSKLVTIFGGSGFVGRYVAQRMAKQGWRVRVAVRRPNEALFVRQYGAVGQVEPVLCNIRDDASVIKVIIGANAVVNCVGILSESGKNTFKNVQALGAERVAKISSENGVANFVQISAIGSNEASLSNYARTKALGEASVLKYFPDATILRPSIIFGPEDQFFNRFAQMATLSPFLPLVGAHTKFQPVHVGDVAFAVEKALSDRSVSGIYELGGPNIETFSELMSRMLSVIQRRRLMLKVPFFVAGLMGQSLDLLKAITFGLFPNNILTQDQVKNLQIDNIVSTDANDLSDLEIRPTAMETVLPEYLWRYRVSGQYASIKDSAKGLKK
ncbi:complex I NDUFA9 subunit family protein [Paracoccaceae bacterium]|nr:complex I NDUFA9 subunit family protein [Paracoccaceae bacterium]